MHEREAASAPPPSSTVARHRRSLPVYVGSGGVATASHYAITIVAVEIFSVAPIVASMMGFAIGAAIKYWLNYSVAFRSRARHSRAMVRFIIALATIFALNTLLFWSFQHGLGMHYIVSQALTTILLLAPGYVIHRQWVFR